jgi:hypothetical protein
MDEVFGEDNFCSIIQVQKTGSQAGNLLANTVDFLLWFAKSKPTVKYRQVYNERVAGHVSSDRYDQIELVFNCINSRYVIWSWVKGGSCAQDSSHPALF